MDFSTIAFSKRKSIKRALARFCYLNKIDLSKEEFDKFVVRTQKSGYKSGVKYISNYLKNNGFNKNEIKGLLFLLTIEFNTELYCKQFPLADKSIQRILNGERTDEDEKFFKETLFDIVKANKLQVNIIYKYS